jgi:hypothetical protein
MAGMRACFFLVAFASLAACRGGTSEPSDKPADTVQAVSEPRAPSASASATAPAAARAASAQQAAARMGEDRVLDLTARFQKEASSRPAGTPRVEDVYAAIAKAGFTFEEQRQHLAAPFEAAYCVGAKTQHDIALSVCEYAGVEAARKGKESSLQLPIPNRAIHVNGATTLTVRQGTKTPESDRAAKKIVEAFAKVPPAK